MMRLTERGRYRSEVALRAAIAVGGGYLLTAAATGLLAVMLPMSRADAVIVSTMFSFALYACTILWTFARLSAWRAGMEMLTAAGMLGALLWIYRSAP